MYVFIFLVPTHARNIIRTILNVSFHLKIRIELKTNILLYSEGYLVFKKGNRTYHDYSTYFSFILRTNEIETEAG